jgi:tetratricopeptide (TPR) repeat protein
MLRLPGHRRRPYRQAQGDTARAIKEFDTAVSIQDSFPYMEPPYWYYPIRQSLGSALLAAGRPADAERAFEQSLQQFPNNGWSLYGLMKAQQAQGNEVMAQATEKRFKQAWLGDSNGLDLKRLWSRGRGGHALGRRRCVGFEGPPHPSEAAPAFGWLALVSALLMGWTSYRSAKAALEAATFERLTTIREAKKRQIDSYFREIREHVLTLASTPWIIQTTEQLAHAFHTWPLQDSQPATWPELHKTAVRSYYEREFLPKLQGAAERSHTVDDYWPADAPTVLLQYHYIAANPHPTGEKDRLVEAALDSLYGRMHAEIHPTRVIFSRRSVSTTFF